MGLRPAALAVTLVGAAIVVAPARAAFPGVPGPIAYSKVKYSENGTTGRLLAHSPRRLGGNRRLTQDPGDSTPAYSPNGHQIVFARVTPFREAASHILLMDADGSDVIALTEGAIKDANPSFSPDGRQVVFDRHPREGGPSDILIVNVDGSGLRRLTEGPSSDEDPTFTPNGERIVFTSNRDSDVRTDRSDIFSMNPDGTDIRVLIDGPRNESEPDVSPNGRRIAFVSNRRHGPHIFVAGLNGSHVRQLTDDPRRGFSDMDYTHPSWAPDGKHIALLRSGRYLSSLEVMRPNGTQRKEFEGAGTEAEGYGTVIGPPGWGPAPG